MERWEAIAEEEVDKAVKNMSKREGRDAWESLSVCSHSLGRKLEAVIEEDDKMLKENFLAFSHGCSEIQRHLVKIKEIGGRHDPFH